MKGRREILELLLNNSVENTGDRGFFFATVSGVVTTNPGMIRRVDDDVPEIGLITTKSFQVKPNLGNREPVVAEIEEGSFGNAVGLRNPGMTEGLKGLEKMMEDGPLSSILNVSVSGNSVEEFVVLVKHFENIADIIELNLSCPHAADGYGMAIGRDPEVVYMYLKEIRKVTDALIFPKLTPNVDSISEIARAAVEGGADGISAINTMGPELYIEPVSGMPILTNKVGGMSGRRVKETALEKVAEIRGAVGSSVPIIGMGGVETGRDAVNMMKAGANTVGIGSLFASVEPEFWKVFFTALKDDAVNGTDTAGGYRKKGRQMDYIPRRITGITDMPAGVRILTLEGRMDFKAGQFAFLFIPGTGEKPFSVMSGDPLVFLIRKRGKFTSRVMELEEGDRIFVRGVYGKDVPGTDKSGIIIAAGGTGIASALKLAEEFSALGKRVHIFHGMSSSGQEVMKEEFLKYGDYTAVPDNGVAGRVLDVINRFIREPDPLSDTAEKIEDLALYTIGPMPFMEKAARDFSDAGAGSEDIFLSIEKSVRCGVGLCGECECGGLLTCREGTFFSWRELNDD